MEAKAPGLLSNHPQREQIIEALLAGESARSIAGRIKPAVHHTTIMRFRNTVLCTNDSVDTDGITG